jgi:hypothetical protein
MRALATALLTLALALGALGLAIAAPHRGRTPEPKAATGGASGALQISNSLDGQAVFSAAAMRPGQTVTGSVRIGNAGDTAGRFSVHATDVRDTPGPYGGALSGRVQLALIDVTRADQPVTVFAGTPAAFATVDLGTFEPGAQRDYRVAAMLPDGGPLDNVLQGAALSFGLEWRATATGGGAPPAAVAPTPAAPSAAVAGEPVAQAPAASCVKRRRLSVRLKAPRGVRVRSATVKVNGKVTARVKGAKRRVRVRLRRVRGNRIRVVVSVRAMNGRSYKSKRSYPACTRGQS